MTDLFGKKKIIVDPSSYFNLDRNTDNPSQINIDSVVSFKNGIYLKNGHPAAATIPFADQPDFLRLALVST